MPPASITLSRSTWSQDCLLTINQLVDMIANIAGILITKKHISEIQQVRGRNSGITRVRQVLGWESEISLEEGLAAPTRELSNGCGLGCATAGRL